MLSLLIRKAVLERKERGPDAADASGCWQREPHFYLPVLLRGLWGAVRRGNLEFSVPPPTKGGVQGRRNCYQTKEKASLSQKDLC